MNGNEKCKLPGMNAQVTGMELASSVGNVVHAIVTTVYIRCLAGPGLPGRLHCKAYGWRITVLYIKYWRMMYVSFTLTRKSKTKQSPCVFPPTPRA